MCLLHCSIDSDGYGDAVIDPRLDYDCTKLIGRLKQICDGTSGLPDFGPGNTREQFIRLWRANPPDMVPRWWWFGVGDVVALLAGLVRIKPWPSCGCSERRAKLNRFGIWVPTAILRP